MAVDWVVAAERKILAPGIFSISRSSSANFMLNFLCFYIFAKAGKVGSIELL